MVELMLVPHPEQQQRIAPAEGLQRSLIHQRVEELFEKPVFSGADYYECAEHLLALRGGVVDGKKKISDPIPTGENTELVVELYDSNGMDGSIPFHSATFVERRTQQALTVEIDHEWPRHKDVGETRESAYLDPSLLDSSLLRNDFPHDRMIAVQVPIHSTLFPRGAKELGQQAYGKVLQVQAV